MINGVVVWVQIFKHQRIEKVDFDDFSGKHVVGKD